MQRRLHDEDESVTNRCAHTSATQPEPLGCQRYLENGRLVRTEDNDWIHLRKRRLRDERWIDLSTLEAIQHHGIPGITLAMDPFSSKKKQRKHSRWHDSRVNFHLSSNEVRLPTAQQISHPQDPFVTPTVYDELGGSLIPVKREKHWSSLGDDPFAKYINWATTENPDGVAIVHEAIDQVNQCLVSFLELL
jgi:hypothetical protein